jgi:hypothetical protein
MSSKTKTITFWFAVLLAGVLLFQIARRTSSVGAVPPRVSAPQQTEYSVIPVGPSLDDVRKALESHTSEGWDLAAPVMNNGTTTALIFKRKKK